MKPVSLPANPAAFLSRAEVGAAASAYADATGYYLGKGQLHRGLSSPSANKIRDGVFAALNSVRHGELRAAAMALYMAGRWSVDGALVTPETQAKLWEDLRDALGLAPGTATDAGLGAQCAHGCPKCDDAIECDCEPPLPMFDATDIAEMLDSESLEVGPLAPSGMAPLRAMLTRPGAEL